MPAQPGPRAAKKGKKRPKVKGCYQCARRRIDCDGARPVCKKCQDKGIECDRLGINFRFCGGVASRGKLAGKQVAEVLSYGSSRHGPRDQKTPSSIETPSPASKPDVLYTPEIHSVVNSLVTTSSKLEILHTLEIQSAVSSLVTTASNHSSSDGPKPEFCWVDAALDHIDGETRFYLNYFATSVAPVQAVIDAGFNGYRDLILPTAETDPMVRETIVHVANQHLAVHHRRDSFGLPRHNSIIRQLILRSSTTPPHEDESALTTLLLLQLGEIISGSGDFKYIYGPLRALVNSKGFSCGSPSLELSHFVKIQMLRVCFFGESLLNESNGVNFLSLRSEESLEFMRYCLKFHPELEELMDHLSTMIEIARSIYIKRALHNPPPCDTTEQIEEFKNLSGKVASHVDLIGRHLLAWSYFVVTAESSTPEHRSFFLGKLEQLHETTRCGNILKAIKQIDTMWALHSTVRWTSVLGGPTQTLIM